ncbi:MAG: FecCD family ABC transporter permease [Acidimicrobiales bacterium]
MIQPERLRGSWLAVSFLALFAACVAGLTVGPADIGASAAVREVLDRLPLINLDSGLTEIESNIVWEVRAPRVALGVLVGTALALAGGSYQAVFRNPLADPYLLGTAAGAGLGATIAIVSDVGDGVGAFDPVPMSAFAGALVAVALSWILGAAGDRRRSPASLLLAGVAVAAFLTAMQTYFLQRNVDDIREVYQWILGRLSIASWDAVLVLLPYVVVTSIVMLLFARVLDVMSVGDAEATTLGIRPGRVRAIVVTAATLATAAAVAASGLIAFVGLIVPHTVRLLFGSSNRVVLPLSAVLGAAFLVGVDLVARTVSSPAEIPIGVVTAVFGAPFFIIVLRSSRRFLA